MSDTPFLCWYCQKPIPSPESTWDEVLSREFDTPVHLSCVRKAIKKNPNDGEALIFADELLPWGDGADWARANLFARVKRALDLAEAALGHAMELGYVPNGTSTAGLFEQAMSAIKSARLNANARDEGYPELEEDKPEPKNEVAFE